MCFEAPGRIVSVAAGYAIADIDGRLSRVMLTMLDLEGTTVQPGDWVVVHTGFAMRRIESDEAHELMRLHRQIHTGVSDP